MEPTAPSLLANFAGAHIVELVTEDFDHQHLAVKRLEGKEAISRVPTYLVTLVSTVETSQAVPLEPAELLGSFVRVQLKDASQTLLRTISGVVRAARRRADRGITHAVYELELAPRASLLDLVVQQEIFLNQDVVEIIRAKLERLDLPDYFELRVTGSYPKQEFVVQYAESDLAFVCRLAEHYGISFHFEEGDDGERIVFGDHSAAFDQVEGDIPFVPRGEPYGVHDLEVEARTIPARWEVQDYNYRKPLQNKTAVHTLEVGMGGVIEYGTHHADPDLGAVIARVRGEEALCRHRVTRGHGAVAVVSAGRHVKISDDAFVGERALLVTECAFEFEQSLGGDATSSAFYRCSFGGISSDLAFRPARLTPRPRLDGVVTGIVQYAPGDESGGLARLDAHGRYIVSLHFDTRSAKEEEDEGYQYRSLPIRMAQPFAGPSQGMHFPLRPGTEVLVAFENGDPDRPVIVGAVPNVTTPSPVVASDSHMHRVRSRHGLVLEFGRAKSSS